MSGDNDGVGAKKKAALSQRGPERPREAQRGPERPREAQRGPERPTESQRRPERPGLLRRPQKGPWSPEAPTPPKSLSILICFYIKKIRPPKSDFEGRPDRVPGQAQRGRCRWATCTVRWVRATLV